MAHIGEEGRLGAAGFGGRLGCRSQITLDPFAARDFPFQIDVSAVENPVGVPNDEIQSRLQQAQSRQQPGQQYQHGGADALHIRRHIRIDLEDSAYPTIFSEDRQIGFHDIHVPLCGVERPYAFALHQFADWLAIARDPQKIRIMPLFRADFPLVRRIEGCCVQVVDLYFYDRQPLDLLPQTVVEHPGFRKPGQRARIVAGGAFNAFGITGPKFVDERMSEDRALCFGYLNNALFGRIAVERDQHQDDRQNDRGAGIGEVA